MSIAIHYWGQMFNFKACINVLYFPTGGRSQTLLPRIPLPISSTPCPTPTANTHTLWPDLLSWSPESWDLKGVICLAWPQILPWCCPQEWVFSEVWCLSVSALAALSPSTAPSISWWALSVTLGHPPQPQPRGWGERERTQIIDTVYYISAIIDKIFTIMTP